MIQVSFKKKVLTGFLALSVLTTSFGGAFVSSVQAASPEEISTEVKEEKTSGKGILLGLAAIGLISALSNHGDSDKKSDQGSSSGSDSNSGSDSGNSTSSGTAAEKQEAFTLLNKDRAANGLPALTLNSKLTSLADDYAADMIKRSYFSHYNPEGESPFDRMDKAGITYTSAGENLAINTSVAAAQTAFMNSSGHRANILNSSFTEVGIGVVHSSDGSVYVVQEFIGK
ncbi:CAP domain-containing protein|uniref:Cysteine-rich secretory protein family protein n=1 Tax=Dendrosporobacter quercicolus TaxID=146817 RepID=A0A1G9VVE5_9FIRM|nr:CAP domain-containing protein [Dendrosporobacter quercicolus]NSL47796.1 CAP domain-containing protein [Dendrosporobacter quercicolus DSM 1736]SDM75837.1 Cysteine-rich secretory protein family protein [Dendrosporobacter quercicolus]